MIDHTWIIHNLFNVNYRNKTSYGQNLLQENTTAALTERTLYITFSFFFICAISEDVF